MFRRFNFIFAAFIALFFILSFASADGYCGDGGLHEEYGEECDDGNFINRDGCSAYCKIEDMEPPTVASVSIPYDATDIDTRENTLTVVFSEPINPETINTFNIRLTHAASPLDIDLSLADDQKTLTITINEDLFSEAVHSLRIKYIKDVAGNIMEEEFISIFTTAVAIDYTPPTVVVAPTGGTYHIAQQVEMIPYINSSRKSEEFIDTTAKIYYTLDGPEPNENSPLYETPISLRNNATLRYFAIDEVGNKTPVFTERYSFSCPDRPNAKTVTHYPYCTVLECNYGFILRNNACVVQMGEADPDDYEANAVTAPQFSSATPMIISTRPAIYITPQHKGIIRRPIIFKDLKRGTIIEFERDTKITDMEGEAFSGYIIPPNNLYIKDFPINFGYSFRSIFEFRAADGRDLEFSPPYKITIPFSDAFNENESVMVFNYSPDTETYTEYSRTLYSTDLDKKEVIITSRKTGAFFIAQTGKNFNKAIFMDTLTHWAKNYIEALYRRGIVQGRSKDIYAPNENLTRAEFVKIVLKAIGAEIENPDEIEDAPFNDVPLYAWYVAYVKKAKDLGLITGYDDGTFKPGQFINRAEAVKMLFSAFGFDLGYRPDEPLASNIRYIDVKSDGWYSTYVDFAVQNGIMEGVPYRDSITIRLFKPGNSITRGEMAKLAIKTIELSEELDN